MSEEPSQQHSSHSDESLLRLLRSGEDDAATALFLRYAQRVERLARSKTSSGLQQRFDAEDVVQSVFRTFFRRAQKGDYQIPDGDELWQLFLVITLNKIRALANYHHAQKRSIDKTFSISSMDEDEQPSKERDNRSNLESGDHLTLLYKVMDSIISSLPPTNQKIVRLRIEGKSLDIIAASVQRSRRTVERVLQQFRETMREILRNEQVLGDE